MSPRPSHTDRNRVREGLSFAFPMQLPPAGTGVGRVSNRAHTPTHKLSTHKAAPASPPTR